MAHTINTTKDKKKEKLDKEKLIKDKEKEIRDNDVIRK